jgi:hypothetical protein
LEHYLKLRRENLDVEFEVSVVGGADQLFFMEASLRKHGFEPALVASALDADPDALGELSLQIMERLVEARRLSNSGETHLGRRGLVMPEKMADWLIGCMLDALSWNNDLHIPRDLIVLVRERLSGSNPEYEQAARAAAMRSNAILLAGQLLAQGVKPSFRLLARLLEVAPSTVKRWFPDGDFEKQVLRASELFDEKGEVRPLADLLGLTCCAEKKLRNGP